MSGYTLSEAEVRLAYIESHENAFPTSRTMHSQEFDRWLADHAARVASESAERVLRELADALNLHQQIPNDWPEPEIYDLCGDAPDRCLFWEMTRSLRKDIEARADRIASEREGQ